LGAILAQKDIDNYEHIIAYTSRTLGPAEVNYSPTEIECLAAIWGMEYFRPYIYMRFFELVTDHSALQWLLNQPNPNKRIYRWIARIADYPYKTDVLNPSNNKIALLNLQKKIDPKQYSDILAYLTTLLALLHLTTTQQKQFKQKASQFIQINQQLYKRNNKKDTQSTPLKEPTTRPEIKLQEGNQKDNPDHPYDLQVQSHIDYITERLQQVQMEASKNIKLGQKKQKKRYDKQVKDTKQQSARNHLVENVIDYYSLEKQTPLRFLPPYNTNDLWETALSKVVYKCQEAMKDKHRIRLLANSYYLGKLLKIENGRAK
ncbi:25151_t:CDS:2, partial [Dentiscutata erythropus]